MRFDARFAALAAGLALALPAHAQTPAQPPSGGAGAQQPIGASPAPQAPTQARSGAMSPIASPQPGQIMGSDLRGANVYGMNNESIGDITDLVIDRDGRVAAVIVGVGGFLGIGQKDVAVPFQALQIMSNAREAANTSGVDMRATGGLTAGGGPTGGVTPAPGTGAAPGMGTTGTGMTGTGAAAPPPNPAGANAAWTDAGATGAAGAGQGVATLTPDRIVLRGMTRADLENAPAFRSDGRAAR